MLGDVADKCWKTKADTRRPNLGEICLFLVSRLEVEDAKAWMRRGEGGGRWESCRVKGYKPQFSSQLIGGHTIRASKPEYGACRSHATPVEVLQGAFARCFFFKEGAAKATMRGDACSEPLQGEERKRQVLTVPGVVVCSLC